MSQESFLYFSLPWVKEDLESWKESSVPVGSGRPDYSSEAEAGLFSVREKWLSRLAEPVDIFS